MDVNIKGMIYPAKFLLPPICCPNCNQPAQGFAGSRMMNLGSDDKRITAAEAMHGVPEHKLRGVLAYTLYPCYCDVDQFWASAFAEEVGRRKKGEEPRDVQGLSQVGRDERKTKIEQQLAALYSQRDAAFVAGMMDKKAGIEREIVLLITELHRIIPGAHNSVPPLNLSPEVLRWAREKKMTLPRGAVDGQIPRRGQVTLKQLHEVVSIDKETYGNLGAKESLALARAIYKELTAYANYGTAVSRLTFETVEKLVPDASEFLKRGTTDRPPIELDVAETFAANLSRRRKRRIDVRKDDDGPAPAKPEDHGDDD